MLDSSRCFICPRILESLAVAKRLFPQTMICYIETYNNTGNTTPCPTLCESCVGSLTSHRIMNIEGLRDGAYGLSSVAREDYRV